MVHCVVYRMTRILVHFSCTSRNIAYIVLYCLPCLLTNEKTYVACNLICPIDIEGLIKAMAVTDTIKLLISRKRCKIDTLLLYILL